MKLLFSMAMLVLSALPVACGRESPKISADPAPTPEAPTRINTMKVEAGNREPLELSARLVYGEDRVSMVSSPLQGRVLEVRVKLGDRVKAGDVLMVMDSPDIAGAYSEYVKEISEFGLAKRNYELAADLFQAKAISIKEFKQAENDLMREQAEFQQAKGRLLSLRVSPDELDKPLSQQKIGSRFELKSPLAGTVVERTVTPGQLVGNDPAQVLFVVADLEMLQVSADMYERDVSLVSPGQTAHMTVEAHPGIDFPTTIAAVGDVVDPVTRTIKVRAWVKNERHMLKPQMFAKLLIPIAVKTEFVVVPLTAVIEAQGNSLVYVERNTGQYEPRMVTVQQISSDYVRVLSGLSTGELIVTNAVVLQRVRGPV